MNTKTNKKMIVISLDAMITEDLAYLKQLKNLGPIIQKGAKVMASQTVYPSLTYTAHASMISGTYPNKHGVINNEIFNPYIKLGDWYDTRASIKAEILPELCERHGYKVAINSWPTMVGADVTYNLQRAGIHQIKEDKKAAMIANSTEGLMEEFYELCKEAWKADKYYDSDTFSGLASKYLIEKYHPDVIFMHMTLIDHYRHVHGVYSKEIEKAMDFIDDTLTPMMETLKKEGIYDETTFVICSDHGQVNIEQTVNVNKKFIEQGWIQLDEEGNVSKWRAFCHSTGASAQIFIDEAEPIVFTQKVKDYLEANREPFKIAQIMTREEVNKAYHLNGPFAFVIEAEEGSAFNYRLDDPFIKAFSNEDYRTSVGTHGHLPTRGSQPALVISGPDINPECVIQKANNVDIAPTCAKILGFEMQSCDGQVLEAFFKA